VPPCQERDASLLPLALAPEVVRSDSLPLTCRHLGRGRGGRGRGVRSRLRLRDGAGAGAESHSAEWRPDRALPKRG